MKRALPSIVILIALSLSGLVLLQVSWFNNLLEVTQEQLFHKVLDVGRNVSVDLSKSVFKTAPATLQRPSYKLVFGTELLRFTKPLSIGDRYSGEDIYNKLKKEFDNKELKKLSFDFAIVSSNEELELQSNNFEKEFSDTVYNKRIFVPIVPENSVEVEGSGAFEHLIIVVTDYKKQARDSVKWIIAGAALFMLIIITAFYITVKALLHQNKLSEIKSDFINNMTHEFKTPLATISLAIDAVRNEKVQNDHEKMQYFSGIIKEENKRMNRHVETILQAALMEKQELQLNLKSLHAHDIIQHALENYDLQLAEKKGEIELLLNAENDKIRVDEVHFTNLISNLVDNAIKYSGEDLHIKITTHSTNKFLVIRVEDNGIGMSKETVKRIFEKFYRAHTGNVHNVKGFGLGMSYVKTVIDAHKAKIKVDSSLGKGSTFTVEVPLDTKE